MLLLYLIPVFIAGYIIVRYDYAHYYTLHKHEGQLLYAKIVFWGSVFCVPLLGIICFLEWRYSVPHTWPLVSEKANLEKAILIKLTVLSFFGPWVWIFFRFLQVRSGDLIGLFNLPDGEDGVKSWLLHKVVEPNPFELMIYEAFLSEAPLFISMRNRKVYIAQVIKASPPSEKHSYAEEILLELWASGYRNSKDLNLSFTTDYKGAALESPIKLVIMKKDILSLSVYEQESFNLLNDEAE